MTVCVEKYWEHEGNKCAVLAISWTDHIHLTGYVGITSDHPLYKIEHLQEIPTNLMHLYKKVQEGPIGKRGPIDMFKLVLDPTHPQVGILFDVHGGITYSGSDDMYPVPNPDLWWFGYDCNHFDDTIYVCNLNYCIAECESLSRQLNMIKE